RRTLRFAGGAIEVDLAAALAIRHRPVGLQGDHRRQPGEIDAVGGAAFDVEGEHGITMTQGGHRRRLRRDAWAEYVATAGFEVLSRELPGHGCGLPPCASQTRYSPGKETVAIICSLST